MSTSGTGCVGGGGASGLLPTGRLSVETATVAAEDDIEKTFEVNRHDHSSSPRNLVV